MLENLASTRLLHWSTMVCGLVGLGWLLPNHYPPWLSFLSDAWTSAIALAGVLLFMPSAGRRIHVPWLAQLALVVAAVPWMQFWGSLLPSIGYAWVYSAFLVAFAFAQVWGANAEIRSPASLVHTLFSVVLLAALLSVGLQIYQAFEGAHLGLLVMWDDSGRPAANLGQPNQLATLLLWALLALLWLTERQRIGTVAGVVAALVLLTGIALTGSRSAWLGLMLMGCFVFLKKDLWRHKQLPLVCAALLFVFVGMVVLRQHSEWLSWLLFTDDPGQQNIHDIRLSADALANESRIGVWRALLDAIRLRPWFGYGVGQVSMAQMSVALDHGYLGYVFSYAHNLFLDFVVWFGVPTGGLLIALISLWFYRTYRRLQHGDDCILFLTVVVIGNHALLEMPLYYLYFLLPFGVFLGTLDSRVRVFGDRMISARWAWISIAAAGLWWAVLIVDYMRIEESFQRLQLQWHRIRTTPQTPYKPLMLKQWGVFFDGMALDPKAGMSASEINSIQLGLLVYPTMVSFDMLASSLALNGDIQGAQEWLKRACKSGNCASLKETWQYKIAHDARYGAVTFP